MSLATAPQPSVRPPADPVSFLWLELTNRCNLECVHCYAESSPHAEDGVLDAEAYGEAMAEAHALGCRRVQLIGGEPTLNPELPALVAHADRLGFEFIEVYTNLTRLDDALLACFLRHGVRVATSIYSERPEVHDAVTTRPGSWTRTVRNLERLLEAGVPVRASIIEMDENRGTLDAVKAWLEELGVPKVGVDRRRDFGRGSDACADGGECDMSELCGRCASGTLCVGPDGVVAPCVFSKPWAVGSLQESSLASIAESVRLRETRRAIHEQTVAVRRAAGQDDPSGGSDKDDDGPPPDDQCMPEHGGCMPESSCGPRDDGDDDRGDDGAEDCLPMTSFCMPPPS